MKHGKNNITLWFDGGNRVSIAQHYENGVKICQEVLDITDGYGGNPVMFGSTIESLILALERIQEEAKGNE